jgi:tRNA (guanine37-N1)-methyltransferase
MRFDLVTIFPDFFRGPLDHGIVRRAQDAGLVEIHIQDLRAFTHDRHRTVDDRPFGGGEGMVLKPEPLFAAVEHLLGPALAPSPQPLTPVVLLSASGKLFRQADARRLAQVDRIILLCGRYEGVDERVAEHLATDEISIGDFVLSGGELAAALVVDAVTRLLPGALGNEDSTANESFSAEEAVSPQPSATSHSVPGELVTRHSSLATGFPNPQPLAPSPGLLDYPHYTRPAEFRGWRVPDVLISGHHADVRRWRRKMALAKTFRNRPELLANMLLSDDDMALLRELQSESASTDEQTGS